MFTRGNKLHYSKFLDIVSSSLRSAVGTFSHTRDANNLRLMPGVKNPGIFTT